MLSKRLRAAPPTSQTALRVALLQCTCGPAAASPEQERARILMVAAVVLAPAQVEAVAEAGLRAGAARCPAARGRGRSRSGRGPWRPAPARSPPRGRPRARVREVPVIVAHGPQPRRTAPPRDRGTAWATHQRLRRLQGARARGQRAGLRPPAPWQARPPPLPPATEPLPCHLLFPCRPGGSR